MGKYSQWLYHREIDQQLRERLGHIEQELHTLQEQATLLGDAASCSDNSILQAIAMQQSAEILLEEAPPPTPPLTNGTKQSSMSVSSALFAWSSLPNFDSRKGIPSDEQQREVSQQTSIPHSEVHRPSPDLASLIEAEDQTQPQLQIPSWLRKAQMTDRPSSGPDERTNTSIQRWLERWGKLVPNPPLEQQTPREGSET